MPTSTGGKRKSGSEAGSSSHAGSSNGGNEAERPGGGTAAAGGKKQKQTQQENAGQSAPRQATVPLSTVQSAAKPAPASQPKTTARPPLPEPMDILKPEEMSSLDLLAATAEVFVPVQQAAAHAATRVAAASSGVADVEKEIVQLSAGVKTRAAAVRCADALAATRRQLERELQKRQQALAQEEELLLELLRDPMSAWDHEAFWQLAACEFALHYDPVEAEREGSRKMAVAFRAAAFYALRRDKGEHVTVPRVKGAYELYSLHQVLLQSDHLRIELRLQLMRFKRLYCSVMSQFGRFRKVEPLPGETLLALFERCHTAARQWQTRGNPGKQPTALDVPQSKVKGAYTAEWIQGSLEAYHTGAGKTLSLRGTTTIAKLFSRRYLKSIPEEERPKHESPGTLCLKDIQAHTIQRWKALENSFSKHVTAVQWDEVQINKVAWSVIIITSRRPDGSREREVIRMAKLKPNAAGESKTGSNVAGAVYNSLVDFGLPLENVQLCCSDSTSYNSSLTIAAAHHKGGAYAHMWEKMRTQGHVLFFYVKCLSHVGHNEVEVSSSTRTVR